MAGPRGEIVEVLVRSALDAMRDVPENFSADEMLSACMTLARRAIVVVLEMRPEARHIVQGAVESLLMDCTDRTKTN